MPCSRAALTQVKSCSTEARRTNHVESAGVLHNRAEFDLEVTPEIAFDTLCDHYGLAGAERRQA